MKKYDINELPYYKVHGRTNGSVNPLTAFWGDSGLEINVRARELWVTINSDYTFFEPWIDIIIDGVRRQKFMLQKGEQRICVYRCPGLQSAEELPVRNVKIFRGTPAMPLDHRTLFQIVSLETDGEFYPLPERNTKIEFIGDSITSGEGATGGLPDEGWYPETFDIVKSYPFMTGELLNADIQLFSQSGWGFFCSWYGNQKEVLPPFYEETCSLVSGKHMEGLGAKEKWDFEKEKTDVVVINLGTNDAGAFSSDNHLVAESMGTLNEMNVDEAGNILPELRARMKERVISFLKTVRKNNKDAFIIWGYGMLSSSNTDIDKQMADLLTESVENYAQETNDKKVMYLKLPMTADEDMGSRGHPGEAAHKKVAMLLAKVIREKVN